MDYNPPEEEDEGYCAPWSCDVDLFFGFRRRTTGDSRADQQPPAGDPGNQLAGAAKAQDEPDQDEHRLPELDSREIAGEVSDGTSLSPSEGDNVIWIQSIAMDRRNELAPIAEFFKGKGIETEIVVHRTSGDAILVTKAGFEQNPAKKGTQGYELMQRIKQLGPVYVEETKDTSFGIKPFQDVLGYKR